MTPQETKINVAIHRSLGFTADPIDVCPLCRGVTPYEAGDDYGTTIWEKCKHCNNTGKVPPCHVGVRDYCNNLNAIREAVLSLSNTKFHRWASELSLLVLGTKQKAPTRQFLCATAAQWAEAYLRAIGKGERNQGSLNLDPPTAGDVLDSDAY